MRYRPITKNKEFCRAYARGKAFVHPKLVLYVNKNRLGRTRVGLTATKKIGGAVQRNRAWAAMTLCSWPGARQCAAKAVRWPRRRPSF